MDAALATRILPPGRCRTAPKSSPACCATASRRAKGLIDDADRVLKRSRKGGD
jgi:hypothetical protein